MNTIRFYTHKGKEVLEITNDHNQIIKKSSHISGNCLVDILFDDKSTSIDLDTRDKINELILRCTDHRTNDIQLLIKRKFADIFNTHYPIKHELIDNEICSVLHTSDIFVLINYLILNIYSEKVIFKQCVSCGGYFATKYINAKYCDRITTKSGRTCKQIGRRKNCTKCKKGA